MLLLTLALVRTSVVIVLLSPYPLKNSRISSVWSIGTVTMLCLQCIVSIPISGLGNHVVHLDFPISVNISRLASKGTIL